MGSEHSHVNCKLFETKASVVGCQGSISGPKGSILVTRGSPNLNFAASEVPVSNLGGHFGQFAATPGTLEDQDCAPDAHLATTVARPRAAQIP